MSLSLEQVVAYLDRIRYSLSSRLPRPDLNLLTVLHELHTRFVTFENMSIIVSTQAIFYMCVKSLALQQASFRADAISAARASLTAATRGPVPACVCVCVCVYVCVCVRVCMRAGS